MCSYTQFLYTYAACILLPTQSTPQTMNSQTLDALMRGRRIRSGYGFAVAVFLAAALTRYFLNDLLGELVPFITFFPAVLIVTFYSGAKPGILTTVLSAITAWYAFLPPQSSMKLNLPAGFALVFFLLVSAMMILVIHGLHRALDELEAGRASVNRQFSVFVQGVTDYAIYMLNPKGIITTWNAGAARIKGYPPEEAVGKHYSMFYTPDERAAHLPDQTLAVATREGRYETEAWRVRKDGSRFFAHVVVDAIFDATGNLLGFTKITRDVSERVQHQQALEQTRAALFQAQKMEAIGQLTGGVAHDFNNMLQAISGGLSVLTRQLSPLSAESRNWIDLIKRNLDRAAGLTQRLLAFSRLQPLNPRAIEPNQLVKGMVQILNQSLGETISIETVLGAGVWNVHADPNELETAILNLAINARDAMPEGGRLTIETANAFLDEQYSTREDIATGQYMLLSISDNGGGMSKEVTAKAFDPFFTTKEQGKGTGLGLSQVHGFIKQSKGHVKIYSELGQGTTVKIYLPRFTGEDIQPVIEGIKPVDVPATGETILVVEDEPDVAKFVARVLSDAGYGVRTAASADEGLSSLQMEPRVDLVLTDVGLPGGKSGRVLADEARQKHPDLRVLFMTAYARNAIIHHGRLDPGVELIVKPFSDRALLEKVSSILGKS
jgi:PAS domain S-box-containing protein